MAADDSPAPGGGAAPPDLFVSYRDDDEDRAFCERLVAGLDERGVRCFFAPRDITPGRPWAAQLDDALAAAAYVGVVVSRQALASDWVTVERSRTNVIPILRNVGPEDLPPTLGAFPALDFRDQAAFEANLDRLATAVGRRIEKQGSTPETPPRRRSGRWLLGTGVAVAALLAVAWLVSSRWGGGELGWWAVEARVEGESFGRGAPLDLRVRSEHDGYLWIFSPVGDLPNRVFPCPVAEESCPEVVAAGRHAIAAGRWRPVPQAGADAFGVTAGAEPGPDELIVLVTRGNDPRQALASLAAMRPELAPKAGAAPAGGWGADILEIEVKE